MSKNLVVLIHVFLFILAGCQDANIFGGQISVTINETRPQITKVKVENDQLIVTGKNFSKVSIAKVEGSTNHTFTIESKSDETLILNAKSALNFLVGETLNLIVSSANASATFPITFELQNGQVTAAKLHHMGASSGQVLKFNGTTWAPANLASSQIYAGTYNASTDTPDVVAAGGTVGTYYIVTTSGAQDLGNGATTFDVGDWVIFNGTTWDKVAIGGNTVSNFNGRTGAVVPLADDYSWSMLTKAAGKLTGSKVSEIADVDVTGIQDGDILQWNIGTSKWEVTAVPAPSIAAGSITNTEIANSSVDSNKISDGSIVNADVSATAAIAQSKILNLTSDLAGKEPTITAGTNLQYIRGNKTLATLNTTAVPEGTNLYFTAPRVLSTAISGYSIGAAVPLTVLDTIPQALGKLEGYAAALSTAQSNYVLLNGTSAMTGDLQMGTHKITGLAAPAANTDAATKKYVDDAITGVSAGSSQWTTAGSDIHYTAGKVGIGTATPGANLHLAAGPLMIGAAPTAVSTEGVIVNSSSARSDISFLHSSTGQNQTTDGFNIAIAFSNVELTLRENGYMRFLTNDTERMRISATGNVGIGTNAPLYPLSVEGHAYINGNLQLGSSGSAQTVTLRAPAGLAGAINFIFPATNGSNNQVLTTDGAGTLSWTTPAGGGGAPTGAAGGDLSGTYPNPTITALDATKVSGGAVDNTEFNFLDGVTSALQAQLNGKEPTITAGTTLQYLRGDKSLATLNTTVVPEGTNEYFTAGRVRTTPINGYSSGTAIPLATTDTILEAFGKLEAQITANDTAFDSTGQWSKVATDIFYTAGNVGIGLTNPSAKFHMRGPAAFESTTNNSSGPTFSFWKSRNFGATLNGDELGFISFYGHDGTGLQRSAYIVANADGDSVPGSAPANLSFFTTSNGGADSTEKMRILADGNVGIGLPDPAANLHIHHATAAQLAITHATGGLWIGAEAGHGSIYNDQTNGFMTLDNNGAEVIRITADHKVGVGTQTPATKLDVSGSLRIGNGGETCSGTTSGAIRFTGGSTDFCDGTNWVTLGNNESVPASTTLLMKTCPGTWTDIGATPGGPGAAQCNGTACRLCTSPASPSTIPASSILLLDKCPSNWTFLARPTGPVGAGVPSAFFAACQSPAVASALQNKNKIIAASCPTNWQDLGATGPSASTATCGASPCRICEIGASSPSILMAQAGASTSDGEPIVLRAGNGGSTSGKGGTATLLGGWGVEGDGGDVLINAGSGSTSIAADKNGGTIYISGGVGANATNGNAGHVFISGGAQTGAGLPGYVKIGPATSGAPVYQLDVDGDINIKATSSLLIGGTPICSSAGCTSSSDRRLKKDIHPLQDSLLKVLQLQGVTYYYKDQQKFGEKHQVGVIAQDVEKVFPQVVVTDKKTGLKAVAYDHLVAPIIEAIKELHQMVVKLLDSSEKHSREIASIKEENKKLKAKSLQFEQENEMLRIQSKKSEQENAAIKAYICQKDPQAALCK